MFSPMFTVNLYRTPHLPPKYASFDVPLWFSKLDLKSYLSSVYNVKVLHIRSTVVQQKVIRDRRDVGRGVANSGYGRLKRPMSKKKMTVELVEPFVWPEEIEDLSPWENETYWTSAREQMAFQRTLMPDAILKPNEQHRKSIAEQAKELLKGKTQWKPTWMSIPNEARVLKGQKPQPSSQISQLSP
jgi:large subunit ribosomal protein L23